MLTRNTLDGFLPELYPIVVSHLPLYATPSTLLALALTSKLYYDIVSPLLYSQVILKSEEQALAVLYRLLGDQSLGHAVRGLHILTDLSLATKNGENPMDVVSLLQKVISAGRIPYIHSFSLHFQSGWYWDNDFQPVKGFGQLRAEFWKELNSQCPRLRNITLGMVGDKDEEEWLEESGIYELGNLTNLRLSFRLWCPSLEGRSRLFNNLDSLSSTLQVLTLHNNIPTRDWISTSEILQLTFPVLQAINLSYFTREDATEAMAFWKRHPMLKSIELSWNEDEIAWFTDDFDSTFLPKLEYLKATFREVRTLAPTLPQLVGLYITESVNAQIPYLLRSVIPNGLPKLKSLAMHHKASSFRENRSIEGALWYETEDGHFLQETVERGYLLTQDVRYLTSIQRGAPNLEEIGIYSLPCAYSSVIPALKSFHGLKRVYFSGMRDDADHLQFATALAEVSNIESVTEVVDRNGPNPSYKVRRDMSGNRLEITKGIAFGMIVGHEDEPFPSEL